MRRVVEVRRTRRPHVNRDAVLVGEPEQRSSVVCDRMMNRAAVLWHFDTHKPLRKPFRNVFLKEARRSNAAVITLHRDWTATQVRQHDRRDRFVVRGQLAFCDPIVRKQDLVRMSDHFVLAQLH